MKLIRLSLATCALCLLSPAVWADGIGQLNAFLRDTKTARGSFEQRVLSASGQKAQQSSGTFALQRPGRFRWAYERPYNQLLVSDGKTLWSYDPELKQAVSRVLGQALSGSPAELLAGGDFDKHFKVSPGGTADGVDYVDAQPRSDSSGFTRMRIGLANNLPVLMEMHDNFGQVTFMRFTRFEANPALAADIFRFTPPKGADVIGD
jgi:outer membrane lipoprotein carrier protein